MGNSGSKDGSYARYISADTAAQQEGIERLGTNSLKELEEKNEFVRGIKSLSDERLKQVRNRCTELDIEYMSKWEFMIMSDEEYKKHKQEHINKKCDYLQQELKVTFNMRDDEVTCREVGDFVFYIMWRGEKPDVRILNYFKLIRDARVTESLDLDFYQVLSYSALLSEEKINSQFYKRLGGTPACLEYLLYKQPQLLFGYFLSDLIQLLFKHLQYDVLHQILMNTRNERGQTCMFYKHYHSVFSNMYRNHADDFYDLLSIRDFTGQTALHVNLYCNSLILYDIITLNNLTKLDKLLTITDNNNQTAQQTISDGSGRKELAWLKRQCDNGNYPLYENHHVLILYNTNERSGAEDEANSIHKAFKFVTNRIELKKMGKKHEVIQTIKEAAAEDNSKMLIVCVMSHGSVGTIEDSERNLMTLTEIEGAMCSHKLKERPKILIAQACQSNERRNECLDGGAASSNSDAGPPTKEKLTVPYEPVADHFLAIQSSVCGQKSDRKFFIPHLAKQIGNSSAYDCFVDLVENTSREMMDEGRKQISIVKSTLRGKICLKDNRYHVYN